MILAVSSQALRDFAQLKILGQPESGRFGLVWTPDGLEPDCVLIWEGEALKHEKDEKVVHVLKSRYPRTR